LFNVVEHYEMTTVFVPYVWNLTTEGLLEGNDWFTFWSELPTIKKLIRKNRSIQNLNSFFNNWFNIFKFFIKFDIFDFMQYFLDHIDFIIKLTQT